MTNSEQVEFWKRELKRKIKFNTRMQTICRVVWLAGLFLGAVLLVWDLMNR